MKGKLTKVTGGENIRTDEVIGSFAAMPTIGKPFIMMNGDPIKKDMGKNTRLIVTSLVRRINSSEEENRIVIFTTNNSTYRLEIDNEIINKDENTSVSK